MKSKLLNNAEYQIHSYKVKEDGTLDILFVNYTCEELSIIFSDKPTLSKIRFMSDTNEIIEIINDYVVEKWVKLVDGIKTVTLTKEASDTEARITQAEAKVIESTIAVEQAQTEIDTLNDTMVVVLTEIVPFLMM